MANQEQVERLKKSVEEWNQWRENSPDVEIDLRDTNFESADLKGANLKGAILANADFFGANLKSANLEGASLESAILSFCNLRSANLKGANLEGANLEGITLIRADLEGAILEGANLEGASLRSVNLSFANLTNAKLSFAKLSFANLSCANLTNANLDRCQLLFASFQDAILTGACIQDWNINNETNFDNVICKYIYLKYEYEDDQIIYKDRRPSDPNQDFKQSDLANLVESSLETVNFVFNNGIDWNAFLSAFQTVQIESNSDELSIQAIEKKRDGSFVVRVDVPTDVDKGEIEKAFFLKYQMDLQAKTEEYEKILKFQDLAIQSKKEEIIQLHRQKSTDLMHIIQWQTQKSLSMEN